MLSIYIVLGIIHSHYEQYDFRNPNYIGFNLYNKMKGDINLILFDSAVTYWFGLWVQYTQY